MLLHAGGRNAYDQPQFEESRRTTTDLFRLALAISFLSAGASRGFSSSTEETRAESRSVVTSLGLDAGANVQAQSSSSETDMTAA